MRYLLDTHALIWHFEDSPNLSQKAANIICDPRNNICISSAAIWEIAIKMNIKRLDTDFTFEELLTEIENNNFNILQLEDKYLREFSALPLIHRDPFDRLFIATAKSEKIPILTVDENIRKYDVAWIW